MIILTSFPIFIHTKSPYPELLVLDPSHNPYVNDRISCTQISIWTWINIESACRPRIFYFFNDWLVKYSSQHPPVNRCKSLLLLNSYIKQKIHPWVSKTVGTEPKKKLIIPITVGGEGGFRPPVLIPTELQICWSDR